MRNPEDKLAREETWRREEEGRQAKSRGFHSSSECSKGRQGRESTWKLDSGQSTRENQERVSKEEENRQQVQQKERRKLPEESLLPLSTY